MSKRSVKDIIVVYTRNEMLLDLKPFVNENEIWIYFRNPDWPQVKGMNPIEVVLDPETVSDMDIEEWRAVKPYCIKQL